MGMLVCNLLTVLEHAIGVFEFLKIFFSQVDVGGNKLFGGVGLPSVVEAFGDCLVKGLGSLARDVRDGAGGDLIDQITTKE